MPKDHLYQGPIVVKKSPVHGYGVFAATTLEKDLIIEECHALVTSISDPKLKNYYFTCLKKTIIPLGYGCIYNHSDTPNVGHSYDFDKNLLIFKTLRTINQGEELFSFYSDTWFSSRKLKLRTTPWWYQTYRFSKRLPLRAVLILCGCLAFIQGIKYLSS